MGKYTQKVFSYFFLLAFAHQSLTTSAMSLSVEEFTEKSTQTRMIVSTKATWKTLELFEEPSPKPEELIAQIISPEDSQNWTERTLKLAYIFKSFQAQGKENGRLEFLKFVAPYLDQFDPDFKLYITHNFNDMRFDLLANKKESLEAAVEAMKDGDLGWGAPLVERFYHSVKDIADKINVANSIIDNMPSADYFKPLRCVIEFIRDMEANYCNPNPSQAARNISTNTMYRSFEQLLNTVKEQQLGSSISIFFLNTMNSWNFNIIWPSMGNSEVSPIDLSLLKDAILTIGNTDIQARIARKLLNSRKFTLFDTSNSQIYEFIQSLHSELELNDDFILRTSEISLQSHQATNSDPIREALYRKLDDLNTFQARVLKVCLGRGEDRDVLFEEVFALDPSSEKYQHLAILFIDQLTQQKFKNYLRVIRELKENSSFAKKAIDIIIESVHVVNDKDKKLTDDQLMELLDEILTFPVGASQEEKLPSLFIKLFDSIYKNTSDTSRLVDYDDRVFDALQNFAWGHQNQISTSIRLVLALLNNDFKTLSPMNHHPGWHFESHPPAHLEGFLQRMEHSKSFMESFREMHRTQESAKHTVVVSDEPQTHPSQQPIQDVALDRHEEQASQPTDISNEFANIWPLILSYFPLEEMFSLWQVNQLFAGFVEESLEHLVVEANIRPGITFGILAELFPNLSSLKLNILADLPPNGFKPLRLLNLDLGSVRLNHAPAPADIVNFLAGIGRNIKQNAHYSRQNVYAPRSTFFFTLPFQLYQFMPQMVAGGINLRITEAVEGSNIPEIPQDFNPDILSGNIDGSLRSIEHLDVTNLSNVNAYEVLRTLSKAPISLAITESLVVDPNPAPDAQRPNVARNLPFIDEVQHLQIIPNQVNRNPLALDSLDYLMRSVGNLETLSFEWLDPATLMQALEKIKLWSSEKLKNLHIKIYENLAQNQNHQGTNYYFKELNFMRNLNLENMSLDLIHDNEARLSFNRSPEKDELIITVDALIENPRQHAIDPILENLRDMLPLQKYLQVKVSGLYKDLKEEDLEALLDFSNQPLDLSISGTRNAISKLCFNQTPTGQEITILASLDLPISTILEAVNKHLPTRQKNLWLNILTQTGLMDINDIRTILSISSPHLSGINIMDTFSIDKTIVTFRKTSEEEEEEEELTIWRCSNLDIAQLLEALASRPLRETLFRATIFNRKNTSYDIKNLDTLLNIPGRNLDVKILGSYDKTTASLIRVDGAETLGIQPAEKLSIVDILEMINSRESLNGLTIIQPDILPSDTTEELKEITLRSYLTTIDFEMGYFPNFMTIGAICRKLLETTNCIDTFRIHMEEFKSDIYTSNYTPGLDRYIGIESLLTLPVLNLVLNMKDIKNIREINAVNLARIFAWEGAGVRNIFIPDYPYFKLTQRVLSEIQSNPDQDNKVTLYSLDQLEGANMQQA